MTFAPAVITRAARYDSGSLDFVVGVDGNISIMLPKTDISFMIDASKNEVYSHPIEIGIDSNIAHGVLIGMTTAYSNTSEDDITGNGLNSVHNYTIPALDSTVHESLFPANRWGYSIDGGAYYNRMPAANEGVMGEILIEDPSKINSQQIYIGAKADISQPLDYYYTTINFTVITNLAAKTIDDIIYMQEMDPDVVASMETNHQYRLRDSRDMKDYWIAKFDDGNVWMTQNLDLDLSPNLILTDEDTDIVDRTWAASTTKKPVDYDLNDSYYMSSNSIERKHLLTSTNGVYKYNYTESERIYGENISECLVKYEDNPKFCNHFKKGQVAYSWLEAVAADSINDVADSDHGEISIDESICPKGWRLPRDYNSGSSTYVTDFPKNTTSKLRVYDENGLLSVTGNLNAYMEPYFFTPAPYWSSTLVDNSYSTNSARYITYSSSLSHSYMSINSQIAVRCMARPSNTFTLEFDLNGGEGTTPEPLSGDSWTGSFTFQLGKVSNIDPPQKAGYNLIGWSTRADATYPEVISNGMDANGAIYSQNGQRINTSFTATNQTTKLYAVWENSVKLNFSANGGRFNTSLYPGETEEEIALVYSTPVSGTIESETRTFSSRDCSYNPKTSINDTTTYCQDNTNTDNPSFGSEYDYVDVTVYYAISGDSTLCIYDGNNNGNYYYNYCSQSLSGNLAEGAYYNASNTYTKTEHYIIRNANNSFAIGWRGGTNNDGQNYWYGYWVEAKAVKTNSNVQYLRSARNSIATPTREGYRFAGWSTNPSANFANWEYNSNLKYPQSLNLYAVWVESPTITVTFSTESSHVTINTPSISWNTAKTIYINKNSNGQWHYYDSEQNRDVIIASVSASSDRFYTVTSSVSNSVLTTSLAKDLNEGDTFNVVLSYEEVPVENLHELTRESCAVAPANTTQRMTDARDGKKYWVNKLADGNCWMTQNLDLEISTGGTTLTSETSAVTGSQTIYASSSWSTSTDANSYFNGGDVYFANGITPTSTSGLADDSELWHYHQGSYYNKKLSTMVCPAGWRLGNYRDLFNYYGITQPKALVFSTVGTAPLQAPLYLVTDRSAASSNKPTEPSNNSYYDMNYTKYWSTNYFMRDIVLTYAPPTYNENYNTPLLLYLNGTNTNNLSAISNTDLYYRNSNTVIYRSAGFVRCVR